MRVRWRRRNGLRLFAAKVKKLCMDMRKLIGRNATRIRKEKGLTPEQLAERCGLSQQYLSGLEQGRRNPTIVTIYELAIALGVSHVDLVRPD
jgi:transcriptional regulator with XRE-family HTH domain